MNLSTAWALLALACEAPRGHDAFTHTLKQMPLAVRQQALSKPLPSVRINMSPAPSEEEIDELQKETDAALQAAKKAIEEIDTKMEQAQRKKEMEKMAALKAEQLSDSIASAVSGAAIGVVLGTLALIEFPALTLDPLLPPLVASTLLAGAAFAAASSDSPAGPIVRNSLGKGIKSLGAAAGDAAKSAAENAVASIVAIPGKIVDAAGKRARETAEEIKQLPGKVADAAKETAKDTADEIARLPGKVVAAAEKKAVETAEELARIPGNLADAVERKLTKTAGEIAKIPTKLVDATERKVKQTTEEIKELPAKLQEVASQKVKEAADDLKSEIKAIPAKVEASIEAKVQEVVSDVKAIPTKVEASIEAKVQEVVADVKAIPQEIKEEVSKVIPAAPKEPVPPKMPPPQTREEPPIVKEASPEKKVPPTPPKVPELRLPEVKLPKIEPPKIPEIKMPEILKAEAPKIPKPPKIPPKTAAPQKEKEDVFVFSEVSLKQFVEGVKPKEDTKEDPAAQKRKEEAEKIRQAELAKKAQEARAKADEAEKKRQAEVAKQAQEARANAEAKRKVDEERERTQEEAKRKGDEERKAAADRAAAERVAQARAAAEAKKKRAEQKREEAERREEERLAREEEKQRVAEQLKAAARRAKQAQESVQSAKPRSTFSLSSLFGMPEEGGAKEVTPKLTPRGPTKKASAPRAVPTITNWKRNSDGSITGRISGAQGFRDGENITTSPVKGAPTPGAVVQTSSGSRYYLDEKQAGGRPSFSVFGGGASKPTDAKTDDAAQRKAQELKAKQEQAREEQQRKAEELKAQQARAREEQRQKAEEQKAKQERYREEQDRKAEELKKAQEQKKLEEKQKQEAKRRELESQKAAAASAMQAPASVKQARPRSTFPLTGLFGITEDDITDDSSALTVERPKVQPQKVSSPPRGMPIISDWSQNRDGSISGVITGGSGFRDGEKITTSPIGGAAIGGAIVQTASGSKYYLEDKDAVARAAKEAQARELEAEKRKKAQLAAEKAAEAKRKAEEAAAAQQARADELKAEKERQAKFAAEKAEMTRRQAEAKRKEAEEKKEALLRAKKAQESIETAKPRSTFSLTSLFGKRDEGPSDSSTVTTPPKPNVEPQKTSWAPRGVPTISGWSQNRNGSITGRISGGSGFKDGERVTTSPIGGKAIGGAIVQTSSGSRYYLEDMEAAAKAAKEARAKELEAEKQRKAQLAAEKAAEEKRKAEEAAAAKQARADALKAEKEEKARLAADQAVARKEEAEKKRREAEEAQAAAARAKEALAAQRIAKPGATISLFGAGPTPVTGSRAGGSSAPKLSEAPRGVPTIINWRTRNDGGITGRIYGSPNFDDGEQVETSSIVSGSVQNGNVVRTGSGSRYFLSTKKPATKRPAEKDLQALNTARPGATITLSREKKELELKQAASKAKPRATFSLFDLSGGNDSPRSAQSSASPPAKKLAQAPRGVPTISKWRKNFDQSITGVISGSPNFGDGDKITTSPIADGTIASGNVVKTGSGSRYFLG